MVLHLYTQPPSMGIRCTLYPFPPWLWYSHTAILRPNDWLSCVCLSEKTVNTTLQRGCSAALGSMQAVFMPKGWHMITVSKFKAVPRHLPHNLSGDESGTHMNT
jgi:hypothetical protein